MCFEDYSEFLICIVIKTKRKQRVIRPRADANCPYVSKEMRPCGGDAVRKEVEVGGWWEVFIGVGGERCYPAFCLRDIICPKNHFSNARYGVRHNREVLLSQFATELCLI